MNFDFVCTDEEEETDEDVGESDELDASDRLERL
jgi:hypothetical protein